MILNPSGHIAGFSGSVSSGGSRSDVEVSLTFVDDEQIRVLNQSTGPDTATDVLSFPQDDEDGFMSIRYAPGIRGYRHPFPGRGRRKPLAIPWSGKWYIWPFTALHLLGFDHEDEEGRAEMAPGRGGMEAIGLRRE